MKTLVKNGLYISLFTLVSFPISYAIRYLLSNNLTLADFGLFYALISFFDMIQTFNDFGFSEAQAYFIPRYLEKQRIDKVKSTILAQLLNQVGTTLVISIAVLFGAEWIAGTIFHSPQAAHLVRLFVLYFLTKDFLLNVKNIFFSFQEAHIYGVQETIRMVCTILLLVIDVKFIRFDLEYVTWAWIFAYAAMAIGYFIFLVIRHAKVLRAQHYPLKKIYKEFFPILFPIFISNNMAILFSTGTETLLAFFKGVVDVGLYNVAKPIANLSLALAVPLSNLLKPYVSQVEERQDHEHISRLVTTIMNTGTFLLLPFILTIVFYSKESVVFLFGEKFIEASNIVKLISIEVFLLIMTNFIYSIVFGLGLQKKRAMVIFASSMVTLVLSLVLIPSFGPIGVALANIGYSFVAAAGGLFIIYQKVPFVLPAKYYMKIALLCVAFIFVQVVLKTFSATETLNQLVLFGLKVLFGMAIYYTIGVFVFKLIDIVFLRKILRSTDHVILLLKSVLVKEKRRM